MTYEERENIFSKEAITINEMSQLLDVKYSTAAAKIKEMKRKVGDRLGIDGRIHVEDYFAYCHIIQPDRYKIRMERPKPAVCSPGSGNVRKWG